jgi:hypothetical protein
MSLDLRQWDSELLKWRRQKFCALSPEQREQVVFLPASSQTTSGPAGGNNWRLSPADYDAIADELEPALLGPAG